MFNKYDRQNRVYGIEGTYKVQNSNVLIIGELCDLTYEISKNLLLSGVNNLHLDLDTKGYDIFKLGNIHKTDINNLIKELKKLNPSCSFKIDNIYDINDYNIVIYINKLLKNNKNKSISFLTTNIANKYQFKIINNFKIHKIIDIDGENYILLSIINIEILNNKYIITTSIAHNLSDNNNIELKLDNNINIKIGNIKIINIKSIEIEKTFDIINFKNGYIRRIKDDKIIEYKNDYTLNNIIDINIFNPIIQYYYGALIASEAIKGITNKYIPINYEENEYESDLVLRPNEYLQNRLHNIKCLIVGAGAIGCEILKNLVSLECSINSNSYIKITDPDHIELSNLSRQFLYRSENIGFSKSKIAEYRVKEFNSKINIISYNDKLCLENQKFINTNFSDIDLVFNALDNLNGRLYVDKQCLKYTKALFESGTLGTKGNTQPIIPYITESYGASQDQEIEESYAVCTIKHFPTLVVHTIHWAQEDFQELFNINPTIIKKYLLDKNYLDNIENNEKEKINNIIKIVLDKLNKVNNVNNYVNWAYELWEDKFQNNIKKLLIKHPDNLIIDNKLFWSHGKKCPKLINFDINNNTIIDYIYATTNLLINTYNKNNIKNLNRIEIITILNNKYIEEKSITSNIDINIQEFEKDDDSNYHILYIQSCSNNRCLNYDIPEADFDETKGIAGKIIPALCTTTSIVSSLIVLEMLKYLLDYKNDYSSSYINLADNTIVQSEPLKPKIEIINNINFTEWDILESDGDIILNEFINYWSDKFNTNIEMIINNSNILYMKDINENNINNKMRDLVDDNIIIIIDDDETTYPNIKINL